MKKTIILILVFSILGLLIGYLIFGKIGDEYVSIKTIFGSTSKFGTFLKDISGIAKIKQNILISGGVGALLGLIIGIRKSK
ncbi:MAG: hypothetical protein A2W99_17125 [Bacteroidetes bacterium GWF2_33_16]|nr:MAG: hypothetical protein A2X00_13670 [Bacteroidetes bacterium GWE2_32_14]OFY03470.1 MAG: hypothetical protein A2W99_17125 [Bacteroidetes bacterium GWF2_33_16]